MNGESFECMKNEAGNEPILPPDESENDSGSSNNQDNGDGTAIAAVTTTTTAKPFVPTVAGERGIFAPWPKKVSCFVNANMSKTAFEFFEKFTEVRIGEKMLLDNSQSLNVLNQFCI